MTGSEVSAQPSGRLSRLLSFVVLRPILVRSVLCGPVALLATALIMGGMAFWWPKGSARVDNIVMPLILFPLIWAGVVFYVLLEENLPRSVIVLTGLIAGHTILVALG